MSQLVNFAKNADFSQNKVVIKKLIETPITKEIQISLPKALTMKEHSAPQPITVMLVAGDLDFYVNDEKIHLEIGDLIYLEAHVKHSLYAIENSIVRLSLAKADSIERVAEIIK
ncbi:cupin [Francisella sp. Scap27]|uniref:cupin domain-containing protein n=1 Tax=Francisella sp. Scap27 TaxID=2589986 RepID=UPI0015C0996C|nr:cupin domain-containing protein [Francisella sp. Scap27]QLE78904.1 cupin [Francisella sp. Scap27]